MRVPIVNIEVPKVIVGYGKTGRSVANYFDGLQTPYLVADDSKPTGLKPGVELISVSELSKHKLGQAIVSPGVPLAHPGLKAAAETGVKLTNDIKMFCEVVEKPVGLVTGSNGKSTVTHMVGQLLEAVGIKTGVGGNIGTPCLDLLAEDSEVFALEVSSYQLELATNCGARVGCLLNLSPDHLDRYQSVEDYYLTKMHVFDDCQVAVINRTLDEKYWPVDCEAIVTFGLGVPANATDFGLVYEGADWQLVRGQQVLAVSSDLVVEGQHNGLNLLAAFAIAEQLGGSPGELAKALPKVTGLPHRCERVMLSSPIKFINDSKATNPESTRVAVSSFAAAETGVSLLLGGVSKGGDFSVLADLLESSVNQIYVYGQDSELIAKQLDVPVRTFDSIRECLNDIKLGDKNGLVLFSPGCASFDQFENFEARGDHFKAVVKELFE